MQFRFRRLRFSFEAPEPIHFGTSGVANTLRGALGYALQPHPERYERVFAPRRVNGPSGLADAARPFVFRTSHSDDSGIEAGRRFGFNMHLFDTGVMPLVVDAFTEVAKTGLGVNRSRVLLRAVEDEDCVVDLDQSLDAVRAVRVRFVTATELKTKGRVAGRPDFPILMARIRDRINELCLLYGEGPLTVDFAGFGKRAEAITTACEVDLVSRHRISTRTGQCHGLGGFVGWADYEGELREFVPLLQAAQFAGVGRQTAWGKGEIRVEIHDHS